MGPLRSTPALLFSLCACSASEPVGLGLPPGARSVLLALERRTATELTAHDAADPLLLAPSLDDASALIAIFYGESLTELGLEPGTIDQGAMSTRPLPSPFLAALERELDGGAPGPVRTLDPAAPALARLRVPELDGASCARTMECLRLDEGARSCSGECMVAPVAISAPTPPVGPAAPAPPLPPELPCPTAWVESAGPPRECRPQPLPARLDCAPGEAQWIDAAACAPVGRACPAGDWPEGLPSDRPVRFVRASGGLDPGGLPAYPTVEAARAGAAAGTLYALAKGAHLAGFELADGEGLRGACAAETRLEGGGALRATRGLSTVEDLRGVDVAVEVASGAALALVGVALEGGGISSAGELAVRGLDVRGAARAILASGGRAVLEEFAIEGAGADAIVASGEGTRVELSRLVVRAASRSALSATGRGLMIAREVALYGAELAASVGGRLELLDAALLPDPRRPQMISGLRATSATVSLTRVLIDRPTYNGVELASSTATLRDLWSYDSGPQDDEAILLAYGASLLDAERVGLRGYDGAAIALLGTTRATMRDVSAGGARGYVTNDAGGGAVALLDEASLSLVRAELYDARDLGLWNGSAATSTATDLRISNTRTDRGGRRGSAIVADRGPLRVERARIEGSAAPGVSSSGAELSLADVEISGPSAEGGVLSGGELSLLRLFVHDVTEVGLRLEGGARARVEDLSVARVSRPTPRAEADGVAVASSSVSIARARLEATLRGLYLRGARARVEDLGVSTVSMRAGGEALAGEAILLELGSHLSLSRARLGGFERRGLDLASSTATVSELDISGRTEDGAPAGGPTQKGLHLEVGSRAEIRGLRIAGLGGIGVHVFESSTLSLEDATVEDVGDVAVRVRKAGSMGLRRARLARARTAGIWIEDEAEMTVSDLEIREVRGGEGGGAGIRVGQTSALTVERFGIEGAEEAGLEVSPLVTFGVVLPTLRATEGLVVGSRVGVRSLLGEETWQQLTLSNVRLAGNAIDVDL